VTDLERRRRIEDLCDAALARDVRERASFVAAACGPDEALRHEVEALLAHAHTAERFLESSIGELAAHVLADDPRASLTGLQIGSYQILSLLGTGGMGDVYRARDTRLGRDVAIKFVANVFLSDPERFARFEREARVLATLNHPHIGAIYGLEEAGGVRGLVLELVEGATLADRLANGPLPVQEALSVARQIAEALEAAHEKGIIHRDLKPANIKITPDGTVKVLDFGLAKALDSPSGSGAEMMNSPTVTPRATLIGIIIGTAAYMAPEQARGKAVDRRADIWAFGVVVYEMLTGRRPFDGDDTSVTLANVLKDEVSWQALPADLPVPVRRLLRRCLEKDPRLRLSAIGDARLELDEAGAPADRDGVRDTPVATRVVGWGRALPWAIATAAVALALAAVWVPRRPPSSSLPLRISADLGADVPLANPAFGAVTILSPDSELLAFVAQNTSGHRQLYIRRLSQLRATPLSGTEDAANPFFSPGGQWIGFFAAGKLKKISVTGGTTATICEAPNGRGGAWAPDGTIVFSPDGREGVVLMRVSSDGGTPQVLTTLDPGETSHRWPQMLPGGKGVLFTAAADIGSYDNADLVVQTLPAGPRKIVHRGGTYGRYLASGHLAFVHEGALVAMPFDLDRLEATGPPVRVIDGIKSNSLSGGAQFDVSPAGTLVYLTGPPADGALEMDWMDRAGRTTVLRQTPTSWLTPRFAPDGTRIALQLFEDRADVWVYELARNTSTRLTSDPVDSNPVWTPDGRRVVFSSVGGNRSAANLYWRLADGTGEAQRLTDSVNTQYPASWHPSGKFLAFEERSDQTASDVMILPMEGDDASGWKPGKPTAFLSSSSSEREPMFSPDGRWIAYWSNESGQRYEVYVRPFANPNSVWQISTGGGEHPTWSRTTRELFYSLNGQIWVASYQVDADSFRADTPRRLAQTHFVERAQNRMFDLHPDGNRFVLAVDANAAADAGEHKAVFVFDFFNELRRFASVTR